jgi:hypothetical protein
MITIYLLKNCKYCTKILQSIKNLPSINVCYILVDKTMTTEIKKKDPRISSYPVAFNVSPNKNGFPSKLANTVKGSQKILRLLKLNYEKNNNKFGKENTLSGTNLEINYKNNNTGNIKNIRQYNKNCFGSSATNTNCHVLDRPFGPKDNLYLLQGYQPSCANPIRINLPIKEISTNFGKISKASKSKTYKSSNSNFGMTTPGTPSWKAERQPWKEPRINLLDCPQNSNGNKIGMNYPQQYTSTVVNKYNPNCDNPNSKFGTSHSKYGSSKYVSALVTDNAPYLTYAAGGNGVSRITGNNFYPEQNPIQKHPTNSYISGNIKQYVNSNKSQDMLKNGLDSKWSINAQGINKYGKHEAYGKHNPSILTQTAFDSDSGNSGVAQYFKRNMFPENGNSFGYKKAPKVPKAQKVPKAPKAQKVPKVPKAPKAPKVQKVPKVPKAQKAPKVPKRNMKFTSPLGIEISIS